MRFESHFDVQAPIDTVWNALLDVERVAPTVPGTQILARTAENAYDVAIKVKVGPMSMTYRGDVQIIERDDTAHRTVMKACARETRGQGAADADVTMVLDDTGGQTSATVTTDVQLSGKVATMGEGVLKDVSGRLVEAFAQNLATMLAPEGGGKARAYPTGTVSEAAAAPPTTVGARTTPAAPQASDALDLGALGGAVILDQLKDPRTLGGLVALVALLAFLAGQRSARG